MKDFIIVQADSNGGTPPVVGDEAFQSNPSGQQQTGSNTAQQQVTEEKGSSDSILPGSGGEGGLFGDGMFIWIFMIAIFLVMYFLMIRPQQKRQKALQKQISEISRGDKILTNGGIYAKVISVQDNIVTATIAENTKVEISKGHIAGVVGKE